MSEPHEETDRPLENAKFEYISYHIGFRFHPQIRLDKSVALAFAGALAEHIDPQQINLESNKLVLAGGPNNRGLAIELTPNELRLSVDYPTQSQEWYEARYHFVIKRFVASFAPEAILGSRAVVRSLLPIDGSAIVFIGGDLMMMMPQRLNPIGRPLGILGLRLDFPPYETKDKSADWDVDIKIESWHQDDHKVFVEAEASWMSPLMCDTDAFNDEVVSRLQTLVQFMEKELLETLTTIPPEDTEYDGP